MGIKGLGIRGLGRMISDCKPNLTLKRKMLVSFVRGEVQNSTGNWSNGEYEAVK